MSNQGRGRGWALTEKDQEHVLRRPGQPAPLKHAEYTSIINEIEKIDIYDPNEISDVDKYIELIMKIKEKESFKNIFDQLMEYVLNDKNFGIKFSKLLAVLKFQDIGDGDKNLRYFVLSTLQNNYEKRKDFRENNITFFRNSISFFGEMFYRAEVVAFPRLLSVPLLDYIDMLLDSGTNEDVELITTQIIRNATKIHDSQKNKLDDVLMRIRKTLLKRNLSAGSTGLLLLIIDISTQNYSLSQNLKNFYIGELKPLISAYMLTVINETASSSNAVPVALSTLSISSNSPRNSKNPNPTPRAIRGSGGSSGPTGGTGHNRQERKSNSKQHHSNNWSSKKDSDKNHSYGHDDRFNKDYS